MNIRAIDGYCAELCMVFLSDKLCLVAPHIGDLSIYEATAPYWDVSGLQTTCEYTDTWNALVFIPT